jgi:hypothetical protein
MKRWLSTCSVLLLGVSIMLVQSASADNRHRVEIVRAKLVGFEEVPTLSSSGSGWFVARIKGDEITYSLHYQDLESTVTQSHIHFSERHQNGSVVVFLCSNLGNGPAGTQLCPAAPATISGTITAIDVLGGAAGVGLEAANFDELLAAIRAGAMYANVHTEGRPPGEIRGQIH